MSLVKLKSSKLINIVFLSAKRAHIWIDVRVCVCPSALLRGRALPRLLRLLRLPRLQRLPRLLRPPRPPCRTAVNDTSVACPAACCERHGEGRALCE